MVNFSKAVKSKLNLQRTQPSPTSPEMMEQSITARKAAEESLVQMLKDKKEAAGALDIRWPKLDSVGRTTNDTSRVSLVFEAAPA